MKSAITLVVPGLFAAEPIGDVSLRAPALEFLLSRAESREPEPVGANYYTRLLWLFGIRTQPNEEPPVAAISHLIDFDTGHEGIWMRADPVSLRPDLHRLVLYDAFPLEKDQALALAQEVNSVLADHGWHIDIGRDVRRWYVRVHELPRLRTHPPREAVGRHVDPFLPHGPEAMRWHGIINAIQMALHDCAVNRARERSGLVPVNSVWFWGAGALPSPASSSWSRLVSDETFALGLAKLCQCPAYRRAETDVQDSLHADGDVLVVLRGELHDAGAWPALVGTLDKEWLEPLLRGLRVGRLSSITLNTVDKIFRLTGGGMRHFWRRRRPLSAYLRSSVPQAQSQP
ncbi:MAG: hypothetical protein ACRED0_06580 [Gammaproteobacteria bacterium]